MSAGHTEATEAEALGVKALMIGALAGLSYPVQHAAIPVNQVLELVAIHQMIAICRTEAEAHTAVGLRVD